MLVVARATSEVTKARSCTLKEAEHRVIARAGGKAGPVGFPRLHMKTRLPVQSACGAPHKTPRPQEQAQRPAGPSASSAPIRFPGRCGVSPLRWVGEDALRLRSGRKLPPLITTINPSKYLKSENFLRKLAHPTGFEPVAYAFGGRHSIQLSYGCFLLTQCLRGNFCDVKALCLPHIIHGNYCKKIPFLSQSEP